MHPLSEICISTIRVKEEVYDGELLLIDLLHSSRVKISTNELHDMEQQ